MLSRFHSKSANRLQHTLPPPYSTEVSRDTPQHNSIVKSTYVELVLPFEMRPWEPGRTRTSNQLVVLGGEQCLRVVAALQYRYHSSARVLVRGLRIVYTLLFFYVAATNIC